MYKPSSETVDVLRQVGYDANTLIKTLEEFREMLNSHPNLISATDKEFVAYLKIKHAKKYSSIERNLDPGSSWRPGIKEMKLLEEEGYWPELIIELLGEFVFKPSKRIPISKFALFQDYVRRRYPLTSINVQVWEPNALIIKLIKQTLQISKASLLKALPYAKNAATKKNIPAFRFPKFFFTFVKHNKSKLLINS